jgi:hypothetical protein
MHILNVELLNLRNCPDTGRITATVILLTETGHLNLQASAAAKQDGSRRNLVETLMQDVMRQIRFMPEVRTGQTRVTLAPDALDRALQET